MESLGVANRGFATNFASWRSAPLRIPPGGAYGLHCMPLKDSSILSWIVEFIVEFIVESEFVEVQNCSVRICSTMTLINWFSDELTYCWVKIWPIGFWWIDHLLKVYHCWSGICFDRPVTLNHCGLKTCVFPSSRNLLGRPIICGRLRLGWRDQPNPFPRCTSMGRGGAGVIGFMNRPFTHAKRLLPILLDDSLW